MNFTVMGVYCNYFKTTKYCRCHYNDKYIETWAISSLSSAALNMTLSRRLIKPSNMNISIVVNTENTVYCDN